MSKKKHLMEYIPDKTLFKAVMFSRSMMRNGTKPPLANHKAAEFYGVKTEDVARYTGQVAARLKSK